MGTISNSEMLSIIREYGENFEKVRTQDKWYVIRCPFCGDSDDPRHAHCYIHCDQQSSEPLIWHCMRCPGKNSGVVNKRFLMAIGVKDRNILKGISSLSHSNKIESLAEEIQIDPGKIDMNSPQVRYLESRLGEFSPEDISKFKILWNVDVVIPLIKDRNGNLPYLLPSNLDSITFLSHDNGMMINRGFRPSDPWVKRKIVDRRGFYVIKTDVDLFTSEPIYVSICEGIMDTLSAYRNFREDNGFNLFTSALGSDYIPALEHVIKMGVVGKNVQVRVYMDSDRNEEFLISELKKYKPIFGSLTIRMNTKFKDIGVPFSMIRIVERRVR